jgi:hypothetical protein
MLVSELVDLVKGYAVQETVEPLKRLGRYVGLGVAGSLFISIGLVELAMAMLRALQSQTGDAFDGGWSFVPYFLVTLACLLVAGLAVSRTRVRREARR